MIKANYGAVELQGNRELLQIEFVSITSSLLATKVINNDELKELTEKCIEFVENGSYKEALENTKEIIVDLEEYRKQMKENEK